MRELDEQYHPVQVEIFRKMTDEQRARIFNEVTRATWNRALEGVRRAHPEFTEPQALKFFIGTLYGHELAAKVYPDV